MHHIDSYELKYNHSVPCQRNRATYTNLYNNQLITNSYQLLLDFYGETWLIYIKISINIPVLTHSGLVLSYGIMELVNIGPGNGLLPDGTKPLLEPIMDMLSNGP